MALCTLNILAPVHKAYFAIITFLVSRDDRRNLYDVKEPILKRYDVLGINFTNINSVEAAPL
ncbi:MAG: hypothetical protein IJU40_05525, partial [Desulfovibrionaceae bacterium]|nr:hypothetical protein [Desulfovibrionaceae bacterium]